MLTQPKSMREARRKWYFYFGITRSSYFSQREHESAREMMQAMLGMYILERRQWSAKATAEALAKARAEIVLLRDALSRFIA